MKNEVKIYDFKKLIEELGKKNEIDDSNELSYRNFLVPGKKLSQVL